MKNSIFTSVIVAFVLLLSSCKSKNIREPEYRDISNIHLIKAGILQSTAGADIIYYNPNNFGVELSDLRGDIYIDGSYFGRVGIGDKVQVAKRSEFTIPAVIRIDMINAVKNNRDIYKKKEAKVKIEGIARVKHSGISVDIPIKYEEVQNIEKLRVLISG